MTNNEKCTRVGYDYGICFCDRCISLDIEKDNTKEKIKKKLSDKSVSQNREYKFRVFLPKHDVTDTISMSEQIYYCDNFLKVHQATHCNSMDKITRPFYIMQYTGLKDKNGVDIYEGDIIEEKSFGGGKGHKNICVYRRDIFGWITILEYLSGKDMGYCIQYGSTDHLTVLGNIYQNPELLSDI